MRPERAETHPPGGGLRQSARFFPTAASMLGAGQRELENHKLKSRLRFKDLFSNDFLSTFSISLEPSNP
jgi:hypothetical protein